MGNPEPPLLNAIPLNDIDKVSCIFRDIAHALHNPDGSVPLAPRILQRFLREMRLELLHHFGLPM
jgi:hypothetical protein